MEALLIIALLIASVSVIWLAFDVRLLKGEIELLKRENRLYLQKIDWLESWMRHDER